MELNTYQDEARRTAIYPVIGRRFVYPALGLAGEAGEVAEKIKKVFRDDEGMLHAARRLAIAEEIGDCLWYVANLSNDLGFTLEEIAVMNINKLRTRLERGTLNGEGDNR